MRLQHLPAILGLTATGADACLPPTFQDRCTDLRKKIQLDYPFTVHIAQYLPPNATIDLAAEGRNETCIDDIQDAYPIPVGICRYSLQIATTNSSEIYVEVHLPEKWTGRVLTAGNAGLGGCILYTTLSYGASQGFASIGADNGHNGSSGGAFYNQPEVLEDFSWRSVYVGTVVGKSIIKQFYEQDLERSYYVGCSMGGRQGWRAVQDNPELFDGVIAGAPGFGLYTHFTYIGNVYKTLGFNASNTLVNLPQWAAVQSAVLAQCDGLDGAHDGIIEDPRFCNFDWSAVSCTTNSSSNCLSPTQIEAASTLFAPLTYNGTDVHPSGQFHGAEVTLFTTLYVPTVQVWLAEIFRYIVLSDISWDPETFTLADGLHAQQVDAGELTTLDPNISAFRDRGGKVLHWHGANDQILSPAISDDYYSSVQKRLNATTAELDEFYRYFRPSGVYHCSGGPGANVLGQLGGQISGLDADDNMITRMVEWVEEGKAPEFVRGTKFVDDVVGGAVEFSRKHCKFPKVNVYKGTGNGTDEEGWECVENC